jgi:hypothetical protein
VEKRSRKRYLHRLWSPDGTYSHVDLRPRPGYSTINSSTLLVSESPQPSPTRTDGYYGLDTLPPPRTVTFAPTVTAIHPPLPPTPEVHHREMSPVATDNSIGSAYNRRRLHPSMLAPPTPSRPFSPASSHISWPNSPASPPPYSIEMPQQQPWRSCVDLAPPPTGDARAARARPMASVNDLSTMLSGQLHAAARSVGNLNAVGGSQNNNGFYERISARLNEVLSEIDNEIFTSGEFVIGASTLRCQEQNGDVVSQHVSSGGQEFADVSADYGSSSELQLGSTIRRYLRFYGC